jgi:hypothetical protein
MRLGLDEEGNRDWNPEWSQNYSQDQTKLLIQLGRAQQLSTAPFPHQFRRRDSAICMTVWKRGLRPLFVDRMVDRGSSA